MGQSHRATGSQLKGPEWVDALLVVGAVVLVVTRTSLAAHPVLFGVVSAFLVGMSVQRLFAWMERPERAPGSPTAGRDEARHDEPRHAATRHAPRAA